MISEAFIHAKEPPVEEPNFDLGVGEEKTKKQPRPKVDRDKEDRRIVRRQREYLHSMIENVTWERFIYNEMHIFHLAIPNFV